LELFAELGEAGEHAEALFVLGTIAVFTGDYRRATGLFERSLAERRGRGDEHTAARHLGGLGTALLNAGDLARARAVLEESLVVARRFEDQWSSAMSLMLLGHLRLAEGDLDGARAELIEAAAVFTATGNMVYLPWCLEGLAEVAAARGRFERAAEIAGARDALRAQTGVLLPPVHPAGYEPMLAAARDTLGAAGSTAAALADVTTRRALGPRIPFTVHSTPGGPVDLRAAGQVRPGAGFRPADPDLAGLVILDFAAFDAWYEEDEQNVAHPRDPFHRIDVLPSSRQVRLELDGHLLALSSRPVLLFETMLPTRYYLPRADITAELVPSSTRPWCAYKGQAAYFSAS